MKRLQQLVLATATLSLFAMHCSSDGETSSSGGAAATLGGATSSGGTSSGGAQSGGAQSGGAQSGGASSGGASSGGAQSGGASSGGSAQGGSAQGGGTAQGGSAQGGSAQGGGTAQGGSAQGGSAQGGSAQGGSAPTVPFTQVADLVSSKCSTNGCHTSASAHVDLAKQGLYMRLTTGMTKGGCMGTTLVTPNDAAGSFLVKVVKARPPAVMCGTHAVGRMPNGCTDQTCLTDAQVKLLSDWIAGGAKEQ